MCHFVGLVFLLILFGFLSFSKLFLLPTRHRCSQQKTCSLKIQPPARSCLNYRLCNVLFTRLISVSPIHRRMKVMPPSSRSAPGLNPRAWLIIDYLWGGRLPQNAISHTQVFRVTFIQAFIYFFIRSFLFVLFKKRINAGRPLLSYIVFSCVSLDVLTS